MGEGWDPRRETLCEYVHRTRNAEQMAAYDDQVERKLEQRKALGYRWLSAADSPVARRSERSAARRRQRSTTERRASLRLPKRATRRTRNEPDRTPRIPSPTEP
jgi:hypothetical protein